MITDTSSLLAELRARGLVQAPEVLVDDRATVSPGVDRPWSIGLLLGVSGWLAGLFLLGFVALTFLPLAASGAGVLGAVLLTAAFCLLKIDQEGAFVSQLALALSIAGQCLALYALNMQAREIAPVAASALALQIGLALAMPNRLHRTLSTFFAAIAWALTVRFAFFGEPAFWRAQAEVAPSLGSSLAGWMLAWLPLLGLAWLLIRREADWMARGWQPALRPILTGLIVSLAFATSASEPLQSSFWFGASAGFGSGLAFWPLLSALAALGGVAAGFALRSKALVGACALGMLMHVSHFYYELGTSLLVKSMLMIAMGAAFWLAAQWLARKETA